MQKCALCEFDYENVSLQEGRCPQCGSVLEWPEELGTSDGVETSSASSKEASEFAVQAPSAFDATNDGKDVDSESVVPDLHKLDAAGALPKEIVQLWRDSIQSSSDVSSTLKGPEAGYTISDSVFSILPREVRSPLNVSDAPVDYELLDIIGQGGVGVVYTARQASIDRTVAIKMLRVEYRSRNEHQEKFLAEAILTGELDHPNIVPIYDLGRNNQGELFYSMKNVIGTPWDRVIAQKSTRENIDILLKVADAVAFAHSRSVVHRDLKPENVMLGSFGEVLVMDWGIAVATEGFRRTSSILRSQAMGGTPAYMAPELATGPMTAIGPAADVYLLGAILFEILTGSPPHYGNDVMECVHNASANIIRETSVTGELMEIAIRAMATLPRRRFRSVQAFQAAIRLYQSHSESLMLSDNAETELNKAISTKDYQGFSRAVFAFDEALSLWDENEAAKLGLLRSKMAYAETAYEKGDYDLGLSLLDESEEDHRLMIKRLRAAIAERDARQNRFKTIRKLAVALTGFIVIAGSIGIIVISTLYSRASKLNADLDASKQKLEGEVENTQKALFSEAEQRKEANEARIDADLRRAEAETAQRNAELARLESIAQRQQAEESSYFAEIGLVGASIKQNQFSIASEILSQQESSIAKSKIRHWEWGRHRFIVRGGSSDDAVQSVATYPTDDSVECIDCSADGNWIAIGKMTGECDIWRLGEKEARATLRHGRYLTDLDFNSTNDLVATSGVDVDNTGTVCIWRLQDGMAPVLEKKLTMKAGQATTVSFSNDRLSEYVAAGDNNRTGRIWKWREEREVVLLGHIDALTSIEFSPNNELVASASKDGTVRVWTTADGAEVQRFTGHDAPALSVVFAPNGKQIASGGADRKILLWSVDPTENRTKRVENVVKQLKGDSLPLAPFYSFVGHEGTVQEVSFSIDGRRIVSGANDNQVFVWSVPVNSTDRTFKPIQKLRGHGGWVRACRFSKDGSQVFSGGDDRSWKSWRLESYREEHLLKDDGVPILDACYSPSKEMIATAHLDGSVSLWNPVSGERIAKLNDGHEYLTNKARVTADGKYLATSAGDNTLRFWDLERGTQLAVMEHSGRDGIFSISQNGQWLVAGGDELGVSIWNLETLAPPNRIRASLKPLSEKETEPAFAAASSVAISNDGKRVLVGDKSGSVEFWDVDKGNQANKVFGHSEAVVGCYFIESSTDRNSAELTMTVSSDGSVAWWEYSSAKASSRDRLRHFASVQLATHSPDGKFLATCASLDEQKTRIWIWDLDKGRAIESKDLAGVIVQDMVFSSTGKPSVFVTVSNIVDSKKAIWSWNAQPGEWKGIGTKNMDSESLLGTVPIQGDTNLLTYGGRGARLWQLQNGKELKNFRPSSSIRSICFDSSGEFLAAASDDGAALIWDVSKRISSQKLVGGHSGAILDLFFSSNHESLITSGSDGRIVVWDLAKGKPISSGKISQSTVIGNALRMSPDGLEFAVACDDNSIRLYDAATLEQKKKLKGHGAAVTCVSFSSDGQWIVSGSQDKTIRLWSVSTGTEIAKLVGHSAPLTSVVFSNDRLRVLSASQDSTVRLWDIGRTMQSLTTVDGENPIERNESLGELLSLEFHSTEVSVAAFSPDGRNIMTAGVDGKGVLWPTERIPPSIRISNPNITYQLGDGANRIDPMAVLCQPGTLDLNGAKIELTVESENRPFGKLLLDSSDGMFSIERGSVVYHSAHKPAFAIGAYSEIDGNRIQISISKLATHTSVEQLIRHIAFQSDEKLGATPPQPFEVTIQILDRDGKSGNWHPEKIRISLFEKRDIQRK